MHKFVLETLLMCIPVFWFFSWLERKIGFDKTFLIMLVLGFGSMLVCFAYGLGLAR